MKRITSVPGAFSGQDYYGSDGKMAHTVDSLFGRQDIFGDASGFSADSVFGGSDNYMDDDIDI